MSQHRPRPRTMNRKWLAAAGAVLFVASLDPLEPPPGAYRFQPPTVYQQYWRTVEDCAQLRGDFTRIHWYAVPDTSFRCATRQGQCGGRWVHPHDIYVVESAPYVLIAHEMLHDLLQRGDHPPVFETCGLMSRGGGGG